MSKTFFSIILFSFIPSLFAQTTSTIIYDAGTNLDVGTAADICAGEIIINGTYSGGGTICSGPLPVMLFSFNASVSKNNVGLTWRTETELNNSGFHVERMKISENQWREIGFVNGHGTTNEPSNYLFEDKKLQASRYKYRLKQSDYNGNFEYFNLTNDVEVGKPNSFSVSQNYPNPSNPMSKIDYEIPVNGKISIKLYNLLGQEVLNIVNEVKEAGYYTAEFNGSSLSSGIYFYRILAEGEGQKYNAVKKMVLVK